MVMAAPLRLAGQSASPRGGAYRDGYAATDAAPAAGAQAGAALAQVDQIMNAAVARGTIPGGVVLVGHDGEVVYRKAFGMRSLEPAREAMTVDTIFDLASMTKCIATATSVMKLVEEGQIRLNDPVAAYLPEFAKNGKENITIRQLLTHFSGLTEDLDLKTAWKGRNAAYQMAMDEKPIFPPGSRFLYSDINFETLGFVVEKVSGLSLDEYAAKNIFEPLAMNETRFLPPAQWRARIAPTEYDENHQMLRGTVHDPTARRMGGVAGHAGLFSTADDLAKFAQDMLTGFHVLSRADGGEDVDAATAADRVRCLRGLGWDIDSPFSSNRGEFFPVGSFRTHRLHGNVDMDRSGDQQLRDRADQRGASARTATPAVVSLRARIASAVAQGLGLTVTRGASSCGWRASPATTKPWPAARLVTARNGSVRTGIDVLESHDFAELREAGKAKTRIAVVTNQTGVDAHGTPHHRCAGQGAGHRSRPPSSALSTASPEAWTRLRFRIPETPRPEFPSTASMETAARNAIRRWRF